MREPFIYDNFPDEVWNRLKAWAKVRAASDGSPTLEECAAYVRSVSKDITGNSEALRPEIVSFYAAETADMVVRFREQFLSEVGAKATAADRSLDASLDGTPQ